MNLIKAIAILSVFTFFACSPTYYKPNTQQITLFEEQGDVNLTIAGRSNTVEVQGAYALTDQFSAAVNYTRFIPIDINPGDGGSGYSFELGPGFYKDVGEDFLFETYAFLGFGRFDNFFIDLDNVAMMTTNTISANAIKLGIQPSIAYKRDKYTLALSSRFTSLNYANIEGDLIFNGQDQIEYLSEANNNFLIEPALTFWIGFEKVKFQAQYGLSFNTTNQNFPMDNQWLSFGINTHFNTGDF